MPNNTAAQLSWLQQHTDLGLLPEASLRALLPLIQTTTLEANQILVTEAQEVAGLYIIQSGRLETFSTRQSQRVWGTSLLPGALVHLQELLFQQSAQRTVLALSSAQVWWVPAQDFQEWIERYPQIRSIFTQQLAQQLAEVTAQLNYEQQRQETLLPYRVPKVARGIVGNSRYAVRLRHQIKEAAEDREPVLVFGEPGLEKDNCCALIHFSSPLRRQPLIKISASRLQSSGADLFGRLGGKPGLLDWLGEGSLIINNAQDLDPQLIPKIAQLLAQGIYFPVSREDELDELQAEPHRCHSQILLISERVLPELQPLVHHLIKVPPLRVRKADIKTQADYYLSLATRSRGLSKPRISPEALRRLQSYDFPGNLRELRNLTDRALLQSAGASVLTEEVFWSTQVKGKQLRLNLLNLYPDLRKFLRSPWWPDRINTWLVVPAFAMVVFILFWGPQDREHNLGLNLFWAWWWPVVLLLFPFLGRIWCAVCPFMIYGEVVQKLSLWLVPRQLRKWPRPLLEDWGGWVLFLMFALIFIWEEVWDLPNTAYLSAWLLLLITAGAIICSLFFERRLWCRYLCPIGGMNGLYAKLAMIELRAQQGTCSAECTTYQCYKGGPAKGEGMETEGCPLYSHPAQLEDNKDCVLCMTCLKACPHRSVELNLRPPGIELWTTHVPRSSEIALLLLLLGGIYLHRLPEIQTLLGIPVSVQDFWPHLLISMLVLCLPPLIPILAYGLLNLLPRKPRPFAELVYGYLPLVLGGTLAHYLPAGLGEAGRILPVTWATFGLPSEGLPLLIAHPAVITFLQGSTLILATLLSVALTQKIARQSLSSLLPQCLGVVAVCISLWKLIVVGST
ncbi:MAG: cyclic nucleotide-binding domain-containing protein [Synechococcaceae cyanobacterium SM2_3_1]|nr:cyclic nucleotide-binding domain-containing protein [Synechococcaceae cyanobacterium SM2_3_1]